MKSYIFNPLKAPQIFGRETIPARGYAVVSEEVVANLRACNIDVSVEGDVGFIPLFVRNIPNNIAK